MESYYKKKNRKIAQSRNTNSSGECICNRPYCNVICNGCGYWTKGRVRHFCPQHPKIVFLYDYSQCPRCRSYDFMLTEISN